MLLPLVLVACKGELKVDTALDIKADGQADGGAGGNALETPSGEEMPEPEEAIDQAVTGEHRAPRKTERGMSIVSPKETLAFFWIAARY